MQEAQPGPRDNPAASDEAGTAAPAPVPFVVTKEHRRFAEFAGAVRRDRYIGLCYGLPGVGKTLSARQYAGWDIVGPFLQAFRPLDVPVPEQAMANRTIIYTPTVHTTARIVDKEITFLHERLSWAITFIQPLIGASRGLMSWLILTSGLVTIGGTNNQAWPTQVVAFASEAIQFGCTCPCHGYSQLSAAPRGVVARRTIESAESPQQTRNRPLLTKVGQRLPTICLRSSGGAPASLWQVVPYLVQWRKTFRFNV